MRRPQSDEHSYRHSSENSQDKELLWSCCTRRGRDFKTRDNITPMLHTHVHKEDKTTRPYFNRTSYKCYKTPGGVESTRLRPTQTEPMVDYMTSTWPIRVNAHRQRSSNTSAVWSCLRTAPTTCGHTELLIVVLPCDTTPHWYWWNEWSWEADLRRVLERVTYSCHSPFSTYFHGYSYNIL